MIFFVCVSDKIPAKLCHAGATVNLHNTLCSDPSLLRSLCRREAGEKKKKKKEEKEKKARGAWWEGEKGEDSLFPSSPARYLFLLFTHWELLRKIVVVCNQLSKVTCLRRPTKELNPFLTTTTLKQSAKDEWQHNKRRSSVERCWSI